MLRKFSFFLVFLITFFVVQGGIAQTDSYILLDDPTGMGPSTNEKTELEKAADSLVAIFPSEYQSQFKVIEGAIYPIMESTDVGIVESWNRLRLKAELESNFYLLLVREYVGNGKIKWRVNLKLPETGGLFGCLNEMGSNFLNSLISRIQSKLNDQTIEGLAIGGIEEFGLILMNIEECCQEGFRDFSCSNCLYDPAEFIKYLTDNEYIKIPIDVRLANRITDYNCNFLTLNKNEISTRSGSIINSVEYDIGIDGKLLSLDSIFNSKIVALSEGFNVYITDFYSVINNNFFTYEKEIKDQKGGVIYFIDNYSANPNLYISPTSVDVNLHQDFSYLLDIQSIEDPDDCPDCPEWVKDIWNNNYNTEEGSNLSYIIPVIPLAAASDGVLPIADMIISAAAAAVATYDLTQRVYMTYIAYNPILNRYYCGRTSGFKVPGGILADRLKMHHAVSKGYIVNEDKSIQGYPVGYWAIRGREQQLIDFYGGAISDSERRPNSKCDNKIRGVSKANPMGYTYHWLSSIAWLEKYPYTGYGTTDIEELWNTLNSIERMKKWFGY